MEECIPLEVLGTLGTLDAEDPRRLHIEHCARCSAMLAAYREFVRADAPGRAPIRDADARLAAFIAERVEAEGTETGGGVARRPRGRWLHMPVFRFVVTTAAFLLVAVAVTRFLPDSSEELVLRGDPRAAFSLQPPRTQGDGALELAWEPVANADAYQVIILGTDLSEVVRLPVTRETRVSVDVGALPVEATRWQVTALREGGTIAESLPANLRP